MGFLAQGRRKAAAGAASAVKKEDAVVKFETGARKREKEKSGGNKTKDREREQHTRRQFRR